MLLKFWIQMLVHVDVLLQLQLALQVNSMILLLVNAVHAHCQLQHVLLENLWT